MSPEWPSEEEGEGIKPDADRPLENTLPIIDPEDLEDEDFDDEDEIEDDEEFDLEIDSEPRVVLITGACGNIGRKLRAAWDEVYDLILLDANPGPDDSDVFKADLSQFSEDWTTHFHGVDTVVHLAANPNQDAVLDDLTGPNLDALANVLNASALAGVDRVVYASSVHVMGGYKDEEVEQITVDLPPKPDSLYGVLKLAGERIGKSLAQAFDLTFIAIRLGWVQAGRNRPDTIPDDWGLKLWLSNHDLVRLFDSAVEAEIEDTPFLVVNGVSRNHGTRWDLSDAAEVLGYLPEDDAFSAAHKTEAAAETADEVSS
jgi:nucleoside-diphosphate-sugar epimerase